MPAASALDVVSSAPNDSALSFRVSDPISSLDSQSQSSEEFTDTFEIVEDFIPPFTTPNVGTTYESDTLPSPSTINPSVSESRQLDIEEDYPVQALSLLWSIIEQKSLDDLNWNKYLAILSAK